MQTAAVRSGHYQTRWPCRSILRKDDRLIRLDHVAIVDGPGGDFDSPIPRSALDEIRRWDLEAVSAKRRRQGSLVTKTPAAIERHVQAHLLGRRIRPSNFECDLASATGGGGCRSFYRSAALHFVDLNPRDTNHVPAVAGSMHLDRETRKLELERSAFGGESAAHEHAKRGELVEWFAERHAAVRIYLEELLFPPCLGAQDARDVVERIEEHEVSSVVTRERVLQFPASSAPPDVSQHFDHLSPVVVSIVERIEDHRRSA